MFSRTGGGAEKKSTSGNMYEALDELTWKEPDGD